MADRVFMSGEPPRIITSKAGYSASPALSDDFKSFDSDWYYGGGIRWTGKVTVPRYNRSIYYNFPYALNFVPAIMVIKTVPLSYYGGSNRPSAGIAVQVNGNSAPLGNLVVTNSSVGPFPTDGAYTQHTYDAYITVFEA